MTAPHLALEAVVRQEGRTLARCLLRRGRYVIGQDRKNEIVVATESVSAVHARLTVVSDDQFFLEDLASARGTFVDGEPIESATALMLESKIAFGEASLTFERGGLPAAIFPHLPAGFLRIARYSVGHPVVQGRTSTIFEAEDSLLRRAVAMKVLRSEMQADAAQVLAFIRDVQITAQLPHAGILPVYDFGFDPDIGLFFTTRFIEGESLADLLTGMASGDPAAPQASLHALLQIFLKACSTVDFAHTRGVIHGALRPEAIVFGRFGEVFVEHWGFAHLVSLHDNGYPPVQAPDVGAKPRLSPCAAPEQAEDAHAIDPRTDVYALGAILFRILTLRHFVEGESADETRDHILHPSRTATELLAEQSPPPHLPGGQWPERLANICIRALSPSPEDRFANAHELRKAVGDWLESVAAGGERKGWRQLAGLLGRP